MMYSHRKTNITTLCKGGVRHFGFHKQIDSFVCALFGLFIYLSITASRTLAAAWIGQLLSQPQFTEKDIKGVWCFFLHVLGCCSFCALFFLGWRFVCNVWRYDCTYFYKG